MTSTLVVQVENLDIRPWIHLSELMENQKRQQVNKERKISLKRNKKLLKVNIARIELGLDCGKTLEVDKKHLNTTSSSDSEFEFPTTIKCRKIRKTANHKKGSQMNLSETNNDTTELLDCAFEEPKATQSFVRKNNYSTTTELLDSDLEVSHASQSLKTRKKKDTATESSDSDYSYFEESKTTQSLKSKQRVEKKYDHSDSSEYKSDPFETDSDSDFVPSSNDSDSKDAQLVKRKRKRQFDKEGPQLDPVELSEMVCEINNNTATELDSDLEECNTSQSLETKNMQDVGKHFEECNTSQSLETKNMQDVGKHFEECNTSQSLETRNTQDVDKKRSSGETARYSQFFEKELKIETVPDSKKKKTYFCFYCKKLVSKFPRHLELVHSNEEDVKKFLHLPKRSKERIDLIAKLRKKFLFIYNTNEYYNTGKFIPTRQPQEIFQRQAENFMVCPVCRGFYAKSSFRRHFRKCSKEAKEGERDTYQKSRAVHGKVHRNANDIVKNKIIPVMRDDECVRSIRYDNLAIVYANKLTEKFRSQHHYSMIRSKLRLIGRLLIEVKRDVKSVQNFSDLFTPKLYDDIIIAVNRVAGFNDEDMKFEAPATAFALGTLLKKCGKILINLCIKNEDTDRKNKCEDFLKIVDEEFSYSINKTVQENQMALKRQKQVTLPSLEDIKKLNSYLNQGRDTHFLALQNSFNFSDWKKLSEYTLTSIQVFNRRRPGEIQRILIEDFEKYVTVDMEVDKDLFSSISENLRKSATDYVTFRIRGKLGRDVPVLLNKHFLNCIRILLQYRTEAGVTSDNPYLFGLPGRSTTGFKLLNACNLLRTFAQKCGAEKPNLLKATELRKHIATRSIMLNLKDRDVRDLARFMGHEQKIHENHYQLPVASRDILKMSRFLENAQGELIEQHSSFSGPSCNSEEILHTETQGCPLSATSSNNRSTLTPTCSKEKKRSTSPKGYVKRTSWNADLKAKVLTIFQDYVEKGQLPSLDHCTEVVKQIPELTKRSPVQLKSFISNQILRSKKEVRRTRRTTMYWTTEEIGIMKKCFQLNLKTGKLPSRQECQQVLEKHRELQSRSKEMIKAWVNNEIRRRKKLNV